MQDLWVVTCEWDLGFNLSGNTGCYSSKDNLNEALLSIDWQDLGFDGWAGAEAEGLLFIEVIKG